MDHAGFSTNYVVNEFIFKSEFVFRDFKDQITRENPFAPIIVNQEDYGILSLGLEYLTEHASGAETNLIFEGQSLLFVERNLREGVIPFQRDLLLGLRHSLNDVAGREFFFSIIADVEFQKEILASVKYSQRFGENWKGQLGLRYIDAPPSTPFDTSGLRSLHKDHQLDMSLTRYF